MIFTKEHNRNHVGFPKPLIVYYCRNIKVVNFVRAISSHLLALNNYRFNFIVNIRCLELMPGHLI